MAGSVVQLKLLHVVGDHTALAVSNSAAYLTPDTGARYVLMQAMTANLRYTLDGVDPVAGARGFVLRTTDMPTLVDLGDSVYVMVIRDTGTDGVLQYQFLR